MQNKEWFGRYIAKALALGATRANVVEAKNIVFDRVFRDICASNACGMYGKCWTCPPDLGEIDELIAEAGEYDYALVYQTVAELEDSFDIEGMPRRGIPTTKSELIIGEKPCGGHGKCGKCKVIARGELSEVTDAEKKHLTADELASGIRLACLTYALGF